MSYIPSIREKELDIKDKNGKIKTYKNEYWQGYLNNKDTEYLRGYDYNTESVIESYFSNLDVYVDDFIKAMGKGTDDSLEDLGIDTDIINNDKELSDYTEEEWDRMPIATKIIGLVKATLGNWIEMQRDELGVSMIESMEEDEFEKIKEEMNYHLHL